MHSFRRSTWTNRALYGGLGLAAVLMLSAVGMTTVWAGTLLWLASHLLLSIYPFVTRDVPDADPDRKPFFETLVLDLGFALLLCVGLLAASMTLGLILQESATPAELPSAADFAGAAETDARSLLYVMLLMAVFVAPWTEEVFFRGFLLNAFRARMSLKWAIFGQALAFGLMHLTWSPMYAVVATLMGIGLGILYVYRDSLRASILAHGMWNGFVALLVLATMFTQSRQAMLGVTGEAAGDRYVISEVVPASPAEAAGLKPGDEIVAIDDVDIDSHEDLVREIEARSEGDEVRLDYARDGQLLKMELRLSTRGEVYE